MSCNEDTLILNDGQDGREEELGFVILKTIWLSQFLCSFFCASLILREENLGASKIGKDVISTCMENRNLFVILDILLCMVNKN